MIPRWPSAASGLTSATTSGTSSSIRKWLVLSTTTAPASTKRGAHSALTDPPAEERTRSRPWIESSLSARQMSWVPFHSISRPTERSEANGTTSAAGKFAIGEQLEDRRPDQPGRAQNSDSVSVARHPVSMTGLRG